MCNNAILKHKVPSSANAYLQSDMFRLNCHPQVTQ